MLTERNIINFLIWTVGIIAGPYLAVESLYGNFVPVGVALAITAVVIIFGYWRDRMVVLPLVATYCIGKFNFLPLKLGLTDVASLSLIGYYIVAYLALKRKMMRLGPLLLAVPIIGIALIIITDEPNFGVHAFGGAREGGRGAVSIIVAALTYLCGVSMNSPSPRFMARVPILALVVCVVFSIPFMLTTVFPSLAPYLYLFSDDINISAYETQLLGDSDVQRNSNLAMIGNAILAVLMAYFPVRTWLQLRRGWVPLLAIICMVLITGGGYRNQLVFILITIFASAWCYISWRAILFVFPIAMVVLTIVGIQSSHLIELPLPMQRTLSILPGDWNPEVKESGKDSNEFRERIIDVYLKEYIHVHPWFGSGVSWDASEFELYNFMEEYYETEDDYWQSKSFITARMPHTGWVNVYEIIGLVGSSLFVLLNLAIIFFTGRAALPRSVDRTSMLYPLKVWLFAASCTHFVVFFTVYGDVRDTFPILCATSVVWFHMNRVEKLGFEHLPKTLEVPFRPERSGLPVPA